MMENKIAKADRRRSYTVSFYSYDSQDRTWTFEAGYTYHRYLIKAQGTYNSTFQKTGIPTRIGVDVIRFEDDHIRFFENQENLLKVLEIKHENIPSGEYEKFGE